MFNIRTETKQQTFHERLWKLRKKHVVTGVRSFFLFCISIVKEDPLLGWGEGPYTGKAHLLEAKSPGWILLQGFHGKRIKEEPSEFQRTFLVPVFRKNRCRGKWGNTCKPWRSPHGWCLSSQTKKLHCLRIKGF